MIGYDKQRKTYFVQYKYKDETGKWKTTMKRGFKLKREAMEYEAKIRLNPEDIAKVGNLTFLQMSDLRNEGIETTKGSKRQRNEHFRRRFSELKDVPIKSITPTMLLQWRAELAKMNYATKTKNTTISYVKSVFDFANEIYKLPDPTASIRNFKKTNKEIMREMQVWTPEEFEKFANAIPEDKEIYKLYFTTLFWTGARRGEGIALQCKDLKDGCINIRGSQRDGKEGIKPTKTKKTRKIKVDDILYAQLMELKNTYKTGYLFGGKDDLAPTSISRVWEKGIKKSGLKPIRIHDLRHSHATWLINNNVNIVAVSKRLGHSSIKQTLDTYAHLLLDTDEKMMATINTYKSSVTPK